MAYYGIVGKRVIIFALSTPGTSNYFCSKYLRDNKHIFVSDILFYER